MLHIVNPPACGDRLSRILQFQRQVLKFACTTAADLPLEQAVVQTEFGEAGAWLWDKLRPHRSRAKTDGSELLRALENVIRHVRLHPEQAQHILTAVDNDVHYNEQLSDPAFRFEYRTRLDPTTQSIVRDLLTRFYTDLLSSGYPECVQGQRTPFNRDSLIQAYYDANPGLEVCAFCDGSRSDVVDEKVYDDADHFFPKSKYPALSVHPRNLVPTCLGCNRSFKGDRDPIRQGDDRPLLAIFHPYDDPAIRHVDVCVSRDSVGDYHVHMRDRAGMPSTRVQNMNHLLNLEQRWEGRLRREIDLVRSSLRKEGRRRQKRGESCSPSIVREFLELAPDEYERELKTKPNFILHNSYLRYAYENDDEFQELCDCLTRG